MYAKHAFARGVWGHAPQENFENTCSEITSESILCQLWLLLLVIKQEYTQDHFHTITYSYVYS